MDLIDTTHVKILANKYLITFSQNPLIGRSAHPCKWGYNPDWTFDPAPGRILVWSFIYTDGTLVLMLNSESGPRTPGRKQMHPKGERTVSAALWMFGPVSIWCIHNGAALS